MDPVMNLFEQFKNGGEQFIYQVIKDEWPESLVLDFKTAANNAGPMKTEDRKVFAEALSGFANSDGGVIVWGVDCRKYNSNDPDTAKDPKPINKLKLFHSDLITNTPQIVSPGVIGVEHHTIPKTNGLDIGYIISYIPKSQDDVHMAVAQNQHRFYFRSGSSFLQMEQYMVADRFGRRPQPKLKFDYRFETGNTDHNSNAFELEATIGITNSGLGIALYPAISIYSHPQLEFNQFGLDGNRNFGLPERLQSLYRRQPEMHFFVGGVNHAIHPDTTLEVTRITIKGKLKELMAPYISNANILIRYKLYCDGFAHEGEESISGVELEQALTKVARRY